MAAEHRALHTSPLPPNYLFPDATSSSAALSADITQLDILLAGPDGTPYAKGVWRLHLKFPGDYPASPPKASFRTKLWHPNVDESTGSVCVDTLKRDWASSSTSSSTSASSTSKSKTDDLRLRHILVTVSCLLIQPNPDSALNGAAAKLFQEDFATFRRQVELMTSIHAGVPFRMRKAVSEAKARGEDPGRPRARSAFEDAIFKDESVDACVYEDAGNHIHQDEDDDEDALGWSMEGSQPKRRRTEAPRSLPMSIQMTLPQRLAGGSSTGLPQHVGSHRGTSGPTAMSRSPFAVRPRIETSATTNMGHQHHQRDQRQQEAPNDDDDDDDDDNSEDENEEEASKENDPSISPTPVTSPPRLVPSTSDTANHKRKRPLSAIPIPLAVLSAAMPPPAALPARAAAQVSSGGGGGGGLAAAASNGIGATSHSQRSHARPKRGKGAKTNNGGATAAGPTGLAIRGVNIPPGISSQGHHRDHRDAEEHRLSHDITTTTDEDDDDDDMAHDADDMTIMIREDADDDDDEAAVDDRERNTEGHGGGDKHHDDDAWARGLQGRFDARLGVQGKIVGDTWGVFAERHPTSISTSTSVRTACPSTKVLTASTAAKTNASSAVGGAAPATGATVTSLSKAHLMCKAGPTGGATGPTGGGGGAPAKRKAVVKARVGLRRL